MAHTPDHHSPWLLDGTYYRRLPERDRPATALDPLRSCVVSLHVDSSDEEEPGAVKRTPVGAAFAVSLVDGEGREHLYLVSTREVVRRCIRHEKIFLRFVLESGDSVDVPTVPYDDWYPHPDPSADIAVHPLSEVPDGANLTPVPMASIMSDEYVKTSQVGPGDALLSVGLFEPHLGEFGPRPVVSSGSLYLMPQIVATRLAGPDLAPIEVEGYLTEWQFWGGASGCPVFRISRPEADSEDRVELLGVMHSHLGAEDPIAMGDVLAGAEPHGEFEIAVVATSQRVRQVLETGPLLEARNEAAERSAIQRIERERNEALEALAASEPAR